MTALTDRRVAGNDLAPDLRGLDVVIAHEWMTLTGGSEKVVQHLCGLFPRARIVTAVRDRRIAAALFPENEVRALWTDLLPGARDRYKYYGPALLAAWAGARLGPADLLISSTHFGALGAGRRFRGPGPHIAYSHTPLRMAWRPSVEAMRLPGPVAPIGRALVPALRRVDRSAARYVDAFVANSAEVAARIDEAYGRRATIVHPPVEVAPLLATPRRPEDYVLSFGRLIPYKRVDLAIAACERLRVPLVVAGAGPEEGRLRAMSGPNVRFVGRVDDDRYRELLAGARALLFPGEEDFGMVPVEAMAAGCPVVAFGRGGVLDTVDNGRTGVLFDRQHPDDVASALHQALSWDWDDADLRGAAAPFAPECFAERFRALTLEVLASGRSGRREAGRSAGPSTRAKLH